MENNILNLLKFNNTINELLGEVKKDKFSLFVDGVTPNINYLLTYGVFKNNKSFVYYVAPNSYKANIAYEAFCKICGYEDVCLYLTDDVIATESVVISDELKHERLNTLHNLINDNKKIIVTDIGAFLKPILSYDEFKKGVIDLKTNEEFVIEDIINKLVKIGYTRVATTYEVGQFSVRGEVLDIYSSCLEKPIRINFAFDEIESIKYFDVNTQLTIEKLESVQIFPMNELIIWDEFKNIEEQLLNDFQNTYSNDVVLDDIENYKNFGMIDKMGKYINYFDSQNDTIASYTNSKIICYDNIKELSKSYDNIIGDIYNYFTSSTRHLDLENEKITFYKEFGLYDYKIDKKIFLGSIGDSINGLELMGIYGINSYKVVDYQNDFKMLTKDLLEKKSCIISLRTKEKMSLLESILGEANVSYIKTDFFNIKTDKINLVLCENALGFGIYDFVELITEDEIFKSNKNSKVRYRSVRENTINIKSSEELHAGDYVVHYDYGISKYLGIKTVELNDTKNDYLRLMFENMELLIPIEKITELEKYLGSEGVVPKLTKIGTNDWEKRKKQVREQLESIAKDLIELQVKRENAVGVKYHEDTEFQKDFESGFEYELTKDQETAINDIKYQMENGKLIDKLICGDVGFGKTEVAMRAAFKTVVEGKQVVYLAPTTILSRQHYYTFKERFEKYGINVRLLNRLITEKEQKDIINGLKNGNVEIVIGTHRLLNGEIKYKDLGLLIIDEEQRFGVAHKESIKKLKDNINVLTLTATPIPRTLQMAITGIRSLSLLETPPKNRYPIQTYVIEYNESVIKDAIYRELSRKGQVFYLHNRIGDIEVIKRKIKKMVPEARICVGHGKMSREELEDVISSFIEKKYDVLLCTTIIETGIDIPNSNTLIVDDATKLGLAQMYQLRGRVGRSDRIAYAYFAYDGGKKLNDSSRKRLDAIKEYNKIGSGYKIAVRDLAIRGAGDILGKEQSGFINSIGIDMYMKLLNETLNKVKGIEEEEKRSYKIDISKHVDKGYVSDDDIIIYIHKQINTINNQKEKEKVIKELTDRFGKLSDDVLIYIDERYLQSLLRKFNVQNILETNNQTTVIIPESVSSKIKGDQLMEAGYTTSDRIDFEYNRQHQIVIKVRKNIKDKSWINILICLLEKIKL